MDELVGVLEKILGVLGYDIYDTYIKAFLDTHKKRIEFKRENEFAIKQNIFDNGQLTEEQKIMLNAVMDKNLKLFKREMDILKIALDNMNGEAKAENLDKDWLLDFFDKASRITEENTKLLWGKLLAYAASNKNICSKTLLNSIFLMGTEDVADFLNICQFCLSEMGVSSSADKITSYPIVFFSKYVNTYCKKGLSSLKLRKLQTLGLIDVDLKSEYVFFEKRVKLIYRNKIVEVENDKKIKIGNIRFTYEGYLLYQMAEKIYNSSSLEFILEVWGKRGYTIYLNRERLSFTQ